MKLLNIKNKNILNINELIKLSEEKRLFGFLDHQSNNLKDISHLIKNIVLKDDNLYGYIKTIDTEKGSILKHMMYVDAPIKLKPRLNVEYDMNNNIIGYNIITFDFIFKNTFSLIKRRKDKLNKIIGKINEK